MKPSDHDRLLREILADEGVERAREASLAQGLATLRSRRRRRAVLASSLASIAVVASFVVLLKHRVTPVAPPSAPPPIVAPPVAAVKVITDEQLLALFPNRAVALIGAPGEQRLMFLDAPPTAVSRGEKR